MLRNTRFVSMAALLAGAAFLVACGGSGSSTVAGGGGGGANTSPTVVSAGDASADSVVAAVVTISAITATSASGSEQLLAAPAQIELTHLDGIRAPLAMFQLPEGTYNSVSVTVKSAQITYVDSTGSVQTASATIPSTNATETITLNPALNVNDTGATDVRLDFDLADSLNIAAGTVTYTPHIAVLAARVKDETGSASHIHVAGTVNSTDTAGNKIAVTTASGMPVTLSVNSSTSYDDSLTLASLQSGTGIHAVATLNSDGTLTATSVADTNGGTKVDSSSRLDNGIVTAVTRDSNGTLTSFQMVVGDGLNSADIGQVVTVNIGAGTAFKGSAAATNAGVGATAFDQSQIFIGQAVWVAGSVGTSANTIVATEIRPAEVGLDGMTTTAVTAGSNGANTLTISPSNMSFASFAVVNVDANSSADYSGQGLTSSTVGSLAVGSPVTVRGFLVQTGTGLTTATTLYTTSLRENAAATALTTVP